MEGTADCAAAMSKHDQRCILVTKLIDDNRMSRAWRRFAPRADLLHRFRIDEELAVYF
jgi:hypothetical protein